MVEPKIHEPGILLVLRLGVLIVAGFTLILVRGKSNRGNVIGEL
jgi:hypothetical protein